MKKVCIGCGRNRLIGKFSQQSRMSDGKNPYCRDCMRAYNKRYKSSQKGKGVQKACELRWRRKNKDKKKEINREYYIKNKARILYNKKAIKETECVLIFDEPKKADKIKINKSREVCTIIIDPRPVRN